jgi:GNAT superfamily N-acetyltransferase
MDAVHIRPARRDEGERIREIDWIACEQFRDVGLPRAADDEPMAVEVLAGYADDGRSWVAVVDGEPVGFLLVDVVDGCTQIEQVSVVPDHQGRGLARALLDRAAEWARAVGAPALTLTTFRDVPWNRPLYEHLGFVVLREDEIGPELADLRAAEAAHGLEPELRVCMRRDVGPGAGTPDLGLLACVEKAMAENLRDFALAYGGEWIDVAGGTAAFTGVGSPLTTVKGAGPHLSGHDLDEIESFFGDRGAPAVTIEAAPSLASSRDLLAERGYRIVGHEDVVARIADGSVARPEPLVEELASQAWPAVMRRSYELADDDPTAVLAEAAAHLPRARLYGVRDGETWIACGQAVWYDDVVVLGCDGTTPEARNRGAQLALIRSRLADVRAGTVVVAEVAPASGSERNYFRCGFELLYIRTHHVRPLAR